METDILSKYIFYKHLLKVASCLARTAIELCPCASRCSNRNVVSQFVIIRSCVCAVVEYNWSIKSLMMAAGHCYIFVLHLHAMPFFFFFQTLRPKLSEFPKLSARYCLKMTTGGMQMKLTCLFTAFWNCSLYIVDCQVPLGSCASEGELYKQQDNEAVVATNRDHAAEGRRETAGQRC